MGEHGLREIPIPAHRHSSGTCVCMCDCVCVCGLNRLGLMEHVHFGEFMRTGDRPRHRPRMIFDCRLCSYHLGDTERESEWAHTFMVYEV